MIEFMNPVSEINKITEDQMMEKLSELKASNDAFRRSCKNPVDCDIRASKFDSLMDFALRPFKHKTDQYKSLINKLHSNK